MTCSLCVERVRQLLGVEQQNTMLLGTLCVKTEAEEVCEDEARARPLQANRSDACGRACSVRLERLVTELGPRVDPLKYTGQIEAKTNKLQARVREKKEKPIKENTARCGPIENFPDSTSPQVESPMNTDIREVPPEKPAVKTFTGKTDSNATHFKCDQCGKGFDLKFDLKKHIQTHELLKKCKSVKVSKDFTCQKCTCTFATKLLLLEHAKSRHDVKYFACSECEFATCKKGHLQRHLTTHTAEKPYKCSQCTSAFSYKSVLKSHLSNHTGEKPHRCNQCSAVFHRLAYLQSHLKIHTKEKPHKCHQCMSTFSHICNLKAHLRTHTGEKPFKCNQCNSAYAHSGTLKNHLRTHTGVKPYKCNECSSAFTRRNDLQIHLRTHTGAKPYKCSQCSSAFARSFVLKRHQRTQH